MTADHVDVSRLDDEVSRRYPYLLAATYYRAFSSTRDLDEAHDYLLDLFEVTLKYLASIALSQYFADAPGDPKIDRDLAALQRPSLGHWQGWLRDILDLYARTERSLAVPELAAFYRQKHTAGLLRAYTTLRELMTGRLRYGGGKNLGVVTPQNFFELLGDYRNLLAHGTRPTRLDRERVGGILGPALRELFDSMRFVADYLLVYVDEVRRAPGSARQGRRYNYYYTTLMGDRPRAATTPRTLDNDNTEPEKLYLLSKEGEFEPLISLYPFVIFCYCDSCSAEQAFVLNTGKGKALDYVSYQCTHHYIQSETLDLQELLGTLGIAVDTIPGEPQPDEPQPSQVREQEEARLMEEERQAREAAEQRVQEEAARQRREREQEAARLEAERQSQEDEQSSAAEEAQRQTQQVKVQPETEHPGQSDAEQSAADKTQILLRKGSKPTAAGSSSPTVGTNTNPTVSTRRRRIVSVALALVLLLGGTVAVVLSIQAADASRKQAEFIAAWEATRTARAVELTSTAQAEIRAKTAIVESAATETAVARLILPSSEAVSPSNANRADLGVLGSLYAETSVASVAFSPDGEMLASGGFTFIEYSLKMWDSRDGTLLHTLDELSSPVRSVAFSPDGQTLASGSDDNTVRLWNAKDGAPLRILEGHNGIVFSVAFSPDGKLLASGSFDRTIRLWNAQDGALLRKFEGHIESVYSVAFSPDGQTLASGSADGTVRLWSINGSIINIIKIQDSSTLFLVYSVAFSPDGKLLASGSYDDKIRLWDTADGTLLHTLEGHTDTVNSAAFSPDGKLLASGSDDKTVRLWNTADGTLLRTLEGHTDTVNSVVFSADGKLIASGSGDNSIKLWGIK